MVFTKISALVQTQWRLLRSAFDAESHKRRVQQRQAKMHSKQQRRAARRAARKARRAQRKQRHTLLSPTAVGEPTDEEERPMISSSYRDKQSKVSTVIGGLVWVHTAEALLDVAVADEGASFFGNEPSGGRRTTGDSRSLQESSSESVDEQLVVESVTTLIVAGAIKAVPQFSVKLTFEIEAQLEQKQREFYDSFGGYSTVDEDDDELLPAVLVGGGHACDAKLLCNWTLVQESEAVLHEATEQKEATDSKPKSFSSSSELVETESEDGEVDLRDSAAFDGYNTHDEEEKSQGVFMTNSEFNGLCAPSINSLSTQCGGKASINVLKSKFRPKWCDVGQDVKVENEDEEEAAVEKVSEIDLTEGELPELSTVLEELETEMSPRMHTFSNEHVLETTQPLQAKYKLFEEQSDNTDFEKGLEDSEDVKKGYTESKGVSTDVKILEQEVLIEEKMSLLPTDRDMLCRQTNAPALPYQSLVQTFTSPPGVYSPGTVSEYGTSIYESLRAREHRYHVTEDIFAKQQSVRPKMRAVLVDWLVEVHQRFELEAQTLYLTVNYVDRYLAQVSVNSQRLQLVGVAALLIASKFEEIYPCDMDDLLYICERSYSKTDLVDCERDLLNVFKFNLAVPSVSSFLGYYLEHFEEDDKLIGQLANYFAECSLLDCTFGATYEPSIVACACLLAAYCYIENQAPSLVWSYRLVELTRYKVEVIIPCTQDLSSILIQPTELTAVATKYSGYEFGEVAHLLLDDLEVLLF